MIALIKSFVANARDYAVYLLVRVIICALQSAPLKSCEALADAMAFFLGDLLKLRSKVIEENLSHAYPDWTQEKRNRMRRAMWRHLILFIAELAHLPRKVHQTNWRDFVELEGKRALVTKLLDHRPTIVVSAHFGNFELAGYMLGLLGFPTYTVARTLDNRYLDRFLNRFRGRTGQFMIPKQDGAPKITAVLESGGTMTFLADQYAGSKGCWVEFFGRSASTHKAIGLFSLTQGAPMFVGGARRLGAPLRYLMRIEDHIDPREIRPETMGVKPLTQWYTSLLEKMIRRDPGQYWWLHRRWKSRRADGKKRSQAA